MPMPMPTPPTIVRPSEAEGAASPWRRMNRRATTTVTTYRHDADAIETTAAPDVGVLYQRSTAPRSGGGYIDDSRFFPSSL